MMVVCDECTRRCEPSRLLELGSVVWLSMHWVRASCSRLCHGMMATSTASLTHNADQQTQTHERTEVGAITAKHEQSRAHSRCLLNDSVVV